MTLNFNSEKLFFIAEIGVNHNGKLALAKKLIREAKKSGADAVKFQLFSNKDLVTQSCKKAPYQIKNTKGNNSQRNMLKKLELSKHNYLKIIKYCRKINIKCFASVFDERNYNFLVNNLKQKIIKIPSGEITNYFLLKEIDLKKTKIIISTGMSKLSEIANAINIISKSEIYNISRDKVFLKNKKKLNLIKKKILVMQCTTDYPLKDNFVNLYSINYLEDKLKLKIGFSDHTPDAISPIIAASRGCKVFEKHFTLNKKMKGPDHSASIDPDGLKSLIQNLKRVPKILGNYDKKMQTCEIKNINSVRKSVVAKKLINRGEIFSLKNLTSKRPGNKFNPINIKSVLGKKAKKDFAIDEAISL